MNIAQTLAVISSLLGGSYFKIKHADCICNCCGKGTTAKGCSLAAHLLAQGWKNGLCAECRKTHQ